MDFIREYVQLINFGLLIAVIGWLIRISSLSRTSLIDQHNAKLETKEKEIEILKAQLAVKDSQYESQITILDHSRTFFERLALLQGDERLQALKLEYDMRMEELERREAAVESEIALSIATEKEALKNEREKIREQQKELQSEAKSISQIDQKTISEVVKVSIPLIKLLMRF